MDSSFEGDEVFAVYCEYLDLVDELGRDESRKRVLEQNPNLEKQLRELFNNEPGTRSLNDLQIGSVIADRYRLVQKLGEGGMGVVWLVQQQMPVRRLVALKIIKRGMDSEQVLSRFEAERQALAMMEHESIARFHDAGLTEDGRSYFVMEFVPGVPINTYCDSVALSIRRRLELFQKVCIAVQHAHQKGIIHRDLKPTNILVSDLHDELTVKIIDFGLAKAITQKLSEKSIYTEHGQIIGTLQYMPPEQAELSALNIDTRADIYALGAVLYELISGTPPLLKEQIQDAAFDAIVKLIRDSDFPRPSIRLSQSKALIASISAARRSEPKRLLIELKSDLDWLILMALEKDRTLRYGSAEDLRREIDQYLNDKPLLWARPHSFSYKAGKWIKRNRIAAMLASVFLVSIAISLIGVGYGLYRSQQSLAIAEKAQKDEAAAALTARTQAGRAQQQAEIANKRLKMSEAQRHSLNIRSSLQASLDGDMISAWNFLNRSEVGQHDVISDLLFARIAGNYGATEAKTGFNLPPPYPYWYGGDRPKEFSELLQHSDTIKEVVSTANSIKHTCFRNDEQLLIAYCDEGLIVSDLSNKTCRTHSQYGASYFSSKFEVDERGKWLAWQKKSGEIELIDLASGGRGSLMSDESIVEFEFMPNRDELLFLTRNGHAVIVSASLVNAKVELKVIDANASSIGRNRSEGNVQKKVSDSLISSECKLFLLGTETGDVEVFERPSTVEDHQKDLEVQFERSATLRLESGKIVGLALYRDAETILVGALSQDGWLVVYDLVSKERRLTCRTSLSSQVSILATDYGKSIEFSNNGRLIIYNEPAFRKEWLIADTKPINLPDRKLKFPHKNRLLIVGADVFKTGTSDGNTNHFLERIHCESPPIKVTRIASGLPAPIIAVRSIADRLVFVDRTGKVRVCLEKNGTFNAPQLQTKLIGFQDEFSAIVAARLEISADQRLAMLDGKVSQSYGKEDAEKKITVWNMEDGEILNQFHQNFNSDSGAITTATFISKGKRLATLHARCLLQVMKPYSGDLVHKVSLDLPDQNVAWMEIHELESGDLFLVGQQPPLRKKQHETRFYSTNHVIIRLHKLSDGSFEKGGSFRFTRGHLIGDNDHAISFSRSGKRCLIRQMFGRLAVINTVTNTVVAVLDLGEGGTSYHNVRHVGDQLLREHLEGLEIWDLNSMKSNAVDFNARIDSKYDVVPKEFELKVAPLIKREFEFKLLEPSIEPVPIPRPPRIKTVPRSLPEISPLKQHQVLIPSP